MFKVGDRVFNYQYGWGTINEELTKYILVLFDNCKSVSIPFAKDGKETSRSERPTLSFTEYTLEGFSQERPIELPEVGELCLVKSYDDKNWVCEYFVQQIGSRFETKDSYNSYSSWDEIKRIKILD